VALCDLDIEPLLGHSSNVSHLAFVTPPTY